MYHLLVSRSIEALQRVEELSNRITNDGTVNPVKQDIIAIYGNMIPAYKATGLKEGYVLTALNYLEWRWNADRNIRPLQAKGELPVLTEDTYLKALNTLKSKYAFRTDLCRSPFGRSPVYYWKTTAAQCIAALR